MSKSQPASASLSASSVVDRLVQGGSPSTSCVEAVYERTESATEPTGDEPRLLAAGFAALRSDWDRAFALGIDEVRAKSQTPLEPREAAA